MINERIRELRTALELNQREFSEKAKIGHSTLAMFETGQRTPKDIHISQICQTFNANEQWLRTGEGTMFNKVPMESEIGKYIGQVLKSDDAFIKDFIISYMSLDEKSKKIVRDFLTSLGHKKDE